MLILKLAWRNLWRNPRRTLITLASIGLGLSIAIIFGSMGAGTYKKVIDQATRLAAGHLTLEKPGYRQSLEPSESLTHASELASLARSIDGVLRTKVLISTQAIAASGAGSSGVSLMGVDPDVEALSSPLATRMTQGRYLQGKDDRAAVIGVQLATLLNLTVGKKMVLTVANREGELSSELVRVSGIFSFGSEDMDGFLVQVPLSLARRALGMGPDEANQVGVVLRHASLQAEVQQQLHDKLRGQPVAIWGWEQVLTELSSWMSLDQRINGVMQLIILFLVGFTILNTILMSVLERSREFAMLLALGTSPAVVRSQVFAESFVLAVLGCVVGTALGASASLYFQAYGLDLSAALTEMPNVGGFALDPVVNFHVRPTHVATLAAFVFVLTLLMGLYPTWKSARIAIAETLRSR